MANEFHPSADGVFGIGEKSGEYLQDRLQSGSLSWWKRFFRELRAAFDAPFQSDWERKSGLHWREWGKL